MRLTHIVDEQTHEDGTRLLSLLLRLMPADRVRQRVIVAGRTPPTSSIPEDVEVSRVGRRLDRLAASGFDLRRVLERHRPDVVYGWSGQAAAAAGAARRNECPIVAVISDPADAGQSHRWWDSACGLDGAAVEVLCASGTVRRRLEESGVSTAAAIIRPGIDFTAIRRATETVRREDLGLPQRGRVLLTASPPSRAGGQHYAVWAAAILYLIWPDMCMVIPGASVEQKRLLRFIESLYCRRIYFPTADRYSPAELLAVSDILVAPAVGDIATGWLAWAMSASVPIVGCAVPAVTELITDGDSGFLCKAGEPHTLATRIREAAESGDAVRQCVETARARAEDLFSTRRCVDQHLEVIDNLLAGGRPGTDTQIACRDI